MVVPLPVLPDPEDPSTPISMSLRLLRESESSELPTTLGDVFAAQQEEWGVTKSAFASWGVVVNTFVTLLIGHSHDIQAMMLSSDHVGVSVGVGLWSSAGSTDRGGGYRPPPAPSGADVDAESPHLPRGLLTDEDGIDVSETDPFMVRLSEFADWTVLLHQDYCLFVSCLVAQQKLLSAIYSGSVSGRALFGPPLGSHSGLLGSLLVGADYLASDFRASLRALDEHRVILSKSKSFPSRHPVYAVCDRIQDCLTSMLRNAGVDPDGDDPSSPGEEDTAVGNETETVGDGLPLLPRVDDDDDDGGDENADPQRPRLMPRHVSELPLEMDW